MAETFDPDPSEVVHPSAPARNYMEVLGAAGSWVATPSDIVTIVDSLDPTTPGWHPLSPAMVDLMRQPVPAVAVPQRRSVVRARADGVRRRLVRPHRHGREAPTRWSSTAPTA